jgi:hypothetical protein
LEGEGGGVIVGEVIHECAWCIRGQSPA